jgi:hypothetical protein
MTHHNEIFSWIAPGGMETLTVSIVGGKVWIEATSYGYEADANCIFGLTMDDAKKLRNALDRAFEQKATDK